MSFTGPLTFKEKENFDICSVIMSNVEPFLAISILFTSREIEKARMADGIVKSKVPRKVLHGFLYCIITYLSIPITINIASSNQVRYEHSRHLIFYFLQIKVMKKFYDPLALVNNYLTFSNLERQRKELIFKEIFNKLNLCTINE